MTERPVLFASYSGVLGGAERVLLDCAARLRRPVLVACPPGPLAAAARAAGLAHAPLAPRSLRVGPGHVAGVLGAARELRRLAGEHEPVALVAWGARATLAAALQPRRGRPPLLAVHHDLAAPSAVGAIVRAATRRADGVAAASYAIARELGGPHPRRAAGGTRSRAAPPGGTRSRAAPRRLTGHGPSPGRGPRTVHAAAAAGRAAARARARRARRVEAAASSRSRSRRACRSCGSRSRARRCPGDDGRLEAALRARAAEPDLAGRVILAGALADVRPALAAAHCLLHCADAEPYGLALVEALAAGRPVVAPGAAGPLEIVTAGAGRLYPPGDAQAAAAALRAVVADTGAGAAARRRAEQAFDVRASAGRLEAAMEAAILSHAGRRSVGVDVTVA